MYIHRVIHFFFTVRKLACNSSKIFSEEDIQKHLHLHICSENNFPTAAGLASSASGFACLGILTDSIRGLKSLPPSLLFFIHLFITSSLSHSISPTLPSLPPPSLSPSISLQPFLYVYLSLFLSLFPVYAIAQVYGLQSCELSAIARYVAIQALSSSIPLLYPDKVQAVHVGVCMVDLLSGREETLMEKEVLQYRFGIRKAHKFISSLLV